MKFALIANHYLSYAKLNDYFFFPKKSVLDVHFFTLYFIISTQKHFILLCLRDSSLPKRGGNTPCIRKRGLAFEAHMYIHASNVYLQEIEPLLVNSNSNYRLDHLQNDRFAIYNLECDS